MRLSNPRIHNLCSVRYPDCIFGGPYKHSAGDGETFGRVYIRMMVSIIAGSHNPDPPFPHETAGLIKTSRNGAGGGFFLRLRPHDVQTTPGISQPSRYSFDSSEFAVETFVTRSAAASHSSSWPGNRAATLPSCTVSVSGPA